MAAWLGPRQPGGVGGLRPGCCADWSPNGRELLYQSGPDERHLDLYTLNIDGTGVRRLTHVNSGYLAYA
ncbi:MAG: hypothetical protein ACRDQZ_03775 [Mycobacteriales bacterium]